MDQITTTNQSTLNKGKQSKISREKGKDGQDEFKYPDILFH